MPLRLEDLLQAGRDFGSWRRPCPGRASASPGSRRSGRRPARAAGRLRRGPRGRRRCRGRRVRRCSSAARRRRKIEIAADLFDLPREHAQGDLRGGAVVRGAERTAARVGDLDGCAGLGAVAVGDVAGEDPRMAGGDAVGRLAVDRIRRWTRRSSHRLQTGDAVLGGGVRGEQAHQALAGERLDDEHVGGGGRGVHGDALRPGFELLQAADQRVGRADVLGARRRRRRIRASGRWPSGSAWRRWAPESSWRWRRSGRRRGRRRRGAPPNQKAMRASKVMAPAIVAATELIRMSRCSTWPSSWATTPSSSLSFISCRMPAVKATEACCGIAAGGEGVGRILGDDVELRHGQAHALGRGRERWARRGGRPPGFSVSRHGLRGVAWRARSCRRRSSWRNS